MDDIKEVLCDGSTVEVSIDDKKEKTRQFVNPDYIEPPEEFDQNLLDKNKDALYNDVTNRLLNEADPSNIKEIVQEFNLAQAKKSAVRVDAYNTILDSVLEQVTKRFAERPDEFSHNDLLNYMQVINNALEKSQKSVSMISETPAIQINNNSVNINVGDSALSRDSKERVADAVREILARVRQQSEQEVVEVEPLLINDDNSEVNVDESNMV